MGWIRPSFIDSMGWAMGEVYGAITDQILINLAHYFPYWKPGESVPKSTFEYQAHMLAQMGQVNRDTIRIIANGLGGGKSALTNILEQAIMEGVRKAQPDLLTGVMRGILKPAALPIVDPSQTRAFQFYYNQAAQKMNLVNTVMLESTRQAYQATVSDVVNRVNATQSALNIGAGETVTGVSSWNEAMRHSINRMKDNGITGFIDHAGHRWSAEAYVSMDIRTTVANTARSAVWETNQNLGNDLYIVSYHDGARPLCYPWQNKVISATDSPRTVIDLDGNEIEVVAQSATSYGEAAGLFGINCKHYPSPFIPGVSVLYNQDNIMGEKENDTVYAQTQQQRAMERKLREEKRDILMAKAQGATAEQLEPLRERARQTSADIDAFCDETGLPRRRNREGVYTQRDFPDPHTYDPATFERQQKDLIDQYFQTGGAQQPYTFGQMTPNEPLVPKTANVAQQVTSQTGTASTMNYGKPFDETGYRKPQLAQLADAKATLDNAPETARKVWSKCAGEMQHPSFGAPGVNGAHYSPAYRRTYYKTYKEAFAESSYQRKNVVWFHEYGHNIDNILGGGGVHGYYSLSYVSAEGVTFQMALEREVGDVLGRFYLQENGIDLYEAVKQAQNGAGGMGFGSFTRQMLKAVMPGDEWAGIRGMLMDAGDDDSVLRPLVDKWLQPQFQKELRSIVRTKPEIADKFVSWVNSRYSIYERSDVSDIFGNYMTRAYGSKYAYPFGVGHKVSYQQNSANMAKEAFAEFFSAKVTGSDTMVGIMDLLPESFKFFEEMLEGVV